MEAIDSLKRVLNLYVTFVEKEGPFLKLWGQTDNNNAVYVEKFLSQVAPQFDIGVGKLQSDGITAGSLVCARYKDGKYYRAKILNNIYVTEGFLEVSFIDFGNKELVSSDDIRSLQNFPPSLLAIPPLAVGFIFAEAHCMGGGEWNDTIFDSIAKEIKYRTVQCTLLTPATNFYLVRVAVEGTDLGSVLLQRGLMQPIPLQAQQAVLLSMSMQKQTAQAPQQTVTSISTGINTYKACTLEPGCQYPVYVSYVNDGPCVFSVQLKQTEDVLVKLMNDINTNTLRLLEDIPIPGTICLARCQDDGNICRAVVTNAVDTQFKVFYVDFGNYEVLPLECLYQIPFKYVLPKVMAIRFALEGVDKSTVTRDMQIAFKRFVDNRLLHMKVIPSPIRTPLPKCELWDPESKTSALDVVIRSAKHSYPEPVVLPRGFSQPVKVSFVYSCNRFYVQLSNKESELTTVMENLQEFCQTNDIIDFNSIKIGIPCCALFSGDNLWYRSEVVEINEDSVKVRYIDYGNEELVMINQLKSIDGEILTVLRPQAIECCLNGYQKMEPDEERDRLLEELILEGVFTMKVVDKLDTKALVDLYDDANYNVASLLLDKLAAAKSQMSPVLAVQAGNKIEHRKSYKQRDQQNSKGERNYNIGREQESWKQPQDKNEKNERSSWRQDGRDNRNYDKKTNDNDSNSWRQNNKGFSPNSRLDKIRKDDTWNSNNDTSVNNNDDWGDSQKTTPPKKNWNSGDGQGNDWNTSTNTEDSRRPIKDFRSNKGGGFNNDRGGRFRDDDKGGRFGDDKGGRFGDNRGGRFGDDRGGRFGNDREGRFGDDRGGRFGDKHRDGGFKKKEFRKDGSESSGSEKNFQKGPRSSSRLDRGNRGQHFDKPKNSYRENRGGGGDAWDSNNTTTDSWNVSTVNTSIDAAPATATFFVYDVVGTDTNVVISWFHNPGHFYCQQISYQDAFNSMMQDICDFYKDKKSEPVVQGAPVVALFPEDNVLYRARVLDVIGTQYKVHYVDFGNESIISKAWPIEKKFMELPAQAIACCLNDIAPPNGEWSNADTYSSYFDKDNFLCQFVNKDEERVYVNLFHNSEDISQVLVGQGLAISTISTIPDIEIPLLLGQQFRATVKSVNNLSDVILALECGLAINCSMHSLVNATETFDDSLKELLEQTVIVYVDNVLEDYRLEVTLYDTEGNKHVILNPDEGAFDTVDIPCPMLVLRSTIYGYVPFADETSIFIQSNENVDLLTSLLDQLFEEYDEKPHDSTIIPEEGLIYAVHSEDTNWYRGKVISFDDDKATVYFIDYGNSEDVAFANLRELARKFLDIPILSLQVTVAEAKSFVDKDVVASVYLGETGWEGTVSVVDASTAIISQTELVSQSKSDDSTDTDTGCITKSEEAFEENTVKEPEVAEISTIENSSTSEEPVASSRGTSVFMSHIDSPNDFYLQFSENLSQIECLQEELQNTVADMEVLENPTPGVLCAAPYSVDQLWYRAEVLDADEDITTVRFVDFGNTDVIDNKSTQIKTLPQKLLSLAIYATRCSLKLEPLEEEWSSVALEVFEKLTSGENLTAEFLEQDEKCTYVLLFEGDINIEEAFIQENLAKPLSKVIETKQTGFVSHLNSPSEFWIQLENCVDELEWIAEQLSNAESFPEQEDLTPGTLCAALFPDDQMWYRARILSNTVAGIELLFIDYGNSCVSMSLRQLPEDLIMTPALAMKCSLSKNEGIPTWSPEAAKKFADISADGQTIFTVKKISTGETSVVQLYLDDSDVSTMLLPSTEDGFITELKSLEDLSLQKESGGDEIKNVILEPLEGQKLDEEAKEKLEELNKQGTTKFQIEFVNEKTVRLYLDGTDIRPLLETFHQDTNSELIVVTKDVSPNMKTENLEEEKCDKEEENLISDVHTTESQSIEEDTDLDNIIKESVDKNEEEHNEIKVEDKYLNENQETNFNEAPQLDSPKKSPISDSENTESEYRNEYEVNRDQKIEIDPEQVLPESSEEKIVEEITARNDASVTNNDQKLDTDIQNNHTIEDNEPQKELDLCESIEYEEETNYNVKTIEDMNILSENNLSQEEEPVEYVEQTEFECREIEESEKADETLVTIDSTEVQYGDSTEENMVSSGTDSEHSETKEQEYTAEIDNKLEISSEDYSEEIIIQEEKESSNKLEDGYTEPNEGKFDSTESIEYLEDHEIDCKREDDLTESNKDKFESTEKLYTDIESIEEHEIDCKKEEDLTVSNEDKLESNEKQYTSIESIEEHEIDCNKEDVYSESNEDKFESTEKQYSGIESIEEHEVDYKIEDEHVPSHVHSEASESTNVSEPNFLLNNDVYDYDVVKNIIKNQYQLPETKPMEFLNISDTNEDLIESSEDTAGSAEDLKIESQQCEGQNNKGKGSKTENCIKEDVLKSSEVKAEAVLSTNDLKNESQESDVKSQDVLEQNTIEIVDDSPKKQSLQRKKSIENKTNKDIPLTKTTEGSKSVKVSKPTPKTDLKSSKPLLPHSKKSTENLAVKSAATKASSVSNSVSNQTLSKTTSTQKLTESSKNSAPKNKVTKSPPKVAPVTKLTGSPKETKTTTKTDDSSKLLNPSAKVTKVNKQSVSTDISTGKKSISTKSISQDNKKTSPKNTKVDNNSKTADKKPEKKVEMEVDLATENVE